MTWEQAERGWLIYALGGGWGHLQRALSLARIAGRLRILTNSRYVCAGYAPACPEGGLINVLLVDTFPRGLVGELVHVLPKLSIPKILIHRDLNPRYVAQTNLRQFVLDNYDLVLVAGELETAPFADLPIARLTAPWLIRSFDELPRRDKLKPVVQVLVCAAGNGPELAWYGAITAKLHNEFPRARVRCVAPALPPSCPPDLWLSYWPAMDLMVTAEVVVGGAGYHTVHECAVLGVPLVCRPWPRKYDRQHLRAQTVARTAPLTSVLTIEEAVAAVRNYLKSPHPRTTTPFENGARQAFEILNRTVPG